MPLEWIDDALAARKASGLDRAPPRADTIGPRIILDGANLLNLSSNDYLGLAADPGTRTILADAARTEPAGATASRLVAGDLPAHRDAERALAAFLGRDDAVLFPSGYAANTGVIPALVGPGDAVLSDELNHASLIDGIRLARATVLVYRHADAQHATDLCTAHLRRHPVRRWLIVTDALFSMDADEAPLVDLADLASQIDAALLVDEAHSLGTLGPDGRGLSARLAVRPDITIGTLGKAFGLAGAFAACDAQVARWIRGTARSFVYSTGTAPILARAVAAQVPRVREAADRRLRLATYARSLRSALRESGATTLPVGESDAPIVPWIVGGPAAAIAASAALRERGVFAQPIRPPTVAAGTSRLRLVPTAAHSHEQIDEILAILREVADLPR